MTQTPDTAPGPYYVTMVDAGRTWFLAGPFATHQEALDLVEPARKAAHEADAMTHFYGFGTARAPGRTKPGAMNEHLGVTPTHQAAA